VSAIVSALLRALPLLADRRVVMLLVVPVAAAVALWIALPLVFWAPMRDSIAALIAGWGLTGGYAWLAAAGGSLGAIVILTAVSGLLALAAIAVLAGPVFARAVETHCHPALVRRAGGTLAGSLANAAVAIAVFVPLWVLALPLALFPPAGIAATLLLNAWLNQRLFRYDALAEHASSAERATVIRSARRRFFGMGLALAPLSFVPLVNLVAPVYAGLAFTCLALDELAALRRSAVAR
jgi:CysZ protein